MGEYEPDDSRNVTLTPSNVPGEPPRTGPREDEARAEAADKPKERHQTALDEADGGSTVRDARGRQQPGYASDESSAVNPDEDSVPIGK